MYLPSGESGSWNALGSPILATPLPSWPRALSMRIRFCGKHSQLGHDWHTRFVHKAKGGEPLLGQRNFHPDALISDDANVFGWNVRAEILDLFMQAPGSREALVDRRPTAVCSKDR